MKYCPKCFTEKTKEEFHKSNTRKDGLTGHCKACCKERERIRRLNAEINPKMSEVQYREKVLELLTKIANKVEKEK